MYKRASACNCLGTSLILYNMLALLLGSLVTATGAYLFYRDMFPPYLDFTKDLLFDPRIVVLSVGVGIVLLALISIVGVCSLNKTLLQLYTYTVLLLLVGQFGVALFTYLNKDHLTKLSEHDCRQLISRYAEDTLYTAMIDSVQRDLKCCGCAGEADYLNIEPPPSCYHNTTDSTGSNTTSAESFEDGCLYVIFDVLECNYLYLILTGILSTLLQFTLITLVNCFVVRHLTYRYAYSKSNRVSPSPVPSLTRPGDTLSTRHGESLQREDSF